MDKIKIAYFVSVLVALVLVTSILRSIVYQPSSTVIENGTVIRHSLVEIDNSSVVQFSVFNKEGRDMNYTIQTKGGLSERNLIVPVKDGRTWRYSLYLGKEDVYITIYREGESLPIENITYYLESKRG